MGPLGGQRSVSPAQEDVGSEAISPRRIEHFDGCFLGSREAEPPMAQEKKVEEPDRSTDITPAPPKLWSTHCDEEVLLRLSRHGPGHETPMTIPELFQESVERFGAYPALASKNGKKWDTLTFSQYYEACRKAAKSLIKNHMAGAARSCCLLWWSLDPDLCVHVIWLIAAFLCCLGLQRFQGVGLLGSNSPEWVIGAISAIFAGGLCVGIYATNSADACQYVIEHARLNILLVENDQQLQKILSIPPDQRESVKAIVQYKTPLEDSFRNLYSWHDFMELGSDITNVQLDRIILSQKANQCAVLIYTSGTTGNPKGVMLSHDNITWTAGAMSRELELSHHILGQQNTIVSYLPLSHISAQMLDIWVPIKVGGLTFFAQPDALRGTLVYTLQEVRPTVFLGVPRVWEKMQENIKENVSKSSSLRKKAFAWAKMLGLKVNTKRMLGKQDIPMNYRMAKALVFTKVRTSLGLDNCHSFFSGAAPLSQDVAEFFLSLDIPIGEMYGMSESSGPHSVSNKNCYKVLSCGRILNGCQNMLYQQNKDGVGEVCMWGRHVFMGYLDMEDATLEVLDDDGWLHSGDLGRMDSQDFLYITGRIKEILITAGGENVSPTPIETLVKEKIPIVSNAVLVGDKARFLSMLLTLKALGSTATTVSAVVKLRDPLIYTAIQCGIDIVNQEAQSDAQRVRKWTVLEKDFSIQGGELGPTSKLRRRIITQKYRTQIDSMYL
ncbi:long-chain-fatty-acid--CoA ligase ACSBG2 isoform X2 [Mesocricetus auratus]|uniref:Long-chain-fatty-acid--CoA ligase ACSBG2 n=1 Tax=Mesocricetus auratus TaxID=10036 RepID=A0ABM2WWP7_MESAU|nr:long-chain-fatty-acid--CoA ligase ACSBG2 isoform X2 [Mesocricetus auratus]